VSAATEIPESMPVVDEARLLSEFGDSPEILAELLELFVQHIPPLVEEITSAISAGDARELTRHAHSLEGACSTYGAPRLSAVCRDLEVLGKENDLETAAARLPDLEDEIQRVIESLDAIIAP